MELPSYTQHITMIKSIPDHFVLQCLYNKIPERHKTFNGNYTFQFNINFVNIKKCHAKSINRTYIISSIQKKTVIISTHPTLHYLPVST